MNTQPKPILVAGAGSWGTALALTLAYNHHSVYLWGHRPETMIEMAENQHNNRYLPGISFPQNLVPVSDLSPFRNTPLDVLIVVPSHAFRATLKHFHSELGELSSVAWATKGMELSSGKLLHTVALEELGEEIQHAVISGPTFAKEIAAKLPAAFVSASPHYDYADYWADKLDNQYLRVYTSNDIVGVQVGGGLKNALAIAAGIADGLGYGANARAALITRGLAELTRLGVAMGGHAETFHGLSGLGDLVLTCTDNQSRNRRMGLALGAGKSIDEAKREIAQAIEGIDTAKAAYDLAKQHNVELPIIEQVYHVLYEGLPPEHAVKALLARTPRHEIDDTT